MRLLNVPFSEKNIVRSNIYSYKRALLNEVEKFVERIRWRVWAFKNPEKVTKKKETYGLKTFNYAPNDSDLVEFEIRLYTIVRNVRFEDVPPNKLQREMKRLLKKIHKDKMMVAKSDKTGNFYQINPNEYFQLMSREVNKEYKMDQDSTTEKLINRNASEIGSMLGVDKRLEVMAKKDAYILMKDHKESFHREHQARLINPSKNPLGQISKFMLDRILGKCRDKFNVNQLRSTDDSIKWFKAIENKPNKVLIKADIANFYPSITEEVVKNATRYFRDKDIDITEDEENVLLKSKIQMARAFGRNWVKKTSSFDNSMGSPDGCEICEYVGLYLLCRLKEVASLRDITIALYRDDLILAMDVNGFDMNQVKSRITKIFAEEKLKMTDWQEGVSLDYLDVEFDIQNDSYKPFKKPNAKTLYINPHSDHPPAIINAIPKIVGDRITKLCSTEEVFVVEKKLYEDALKAQGYKNVAFEFQENETEEEKRARLERKEK